MNIKLNLNICILFLSITWVNGFNRIPINQNDVFKQSVVNFAFSFGFIQSSHAITEKIEFEYNPRNERIYDTKRKSYLPSHPEKYLKKDIQNHKVITIGEVHSNPVHHLIEYRILSSLTGFKGPKKVAVGLECFYRIHQNALDKFIFNHGSLARLKEETNWKETWGWDLSAYSRIFNYAFQNKIRLVGLNCPMQIVKFVSEFGFEAIPGNLKLKLPTLDLSNDIHRSQFAKAIGLGFGAHGKINGALFQKLYESQTLWDEYMAESASNFIQSNPYVTLLVIAGSGHINGRVGIPDRIEKRIGQAPFVIVPTETEWSIEGLPEVRVPPFQTQCDWCWFTERNLSA